MFRSVLGVLLLVWGVMPSGVAAEVSRFECAGRAGVEGRGMLGKYIRRGRVPPKGHVHLLAVFTRFRDEAASEVWAPAYAHDLFDVDVPGSFSHFYREMSRGQLSVSGVCLKKRYASLHRAGHYLGLGEKLENRVGTFTQEILAQVDREVDFGGYDNDGPDGVPNSGDDDGYVDFLFLNLRTVPRGFLSATATGIATLGLPGEYVTKDAAKGGGVIRISNKLGSIQRVNSFSHAVGVMAHEFGHGLGLPDLYDVSFLIDREEAPGEDSAGLGRWGLMARGALGWNDDDGPNPLCAWCREQLGWIGEENRDLVEVTEDRKDEEIGCVWDEGKVYRIPLGWDSRTGSMSEYFLVEHRRPSCGYYDRNMPGSGLLIWHVGDSRDNRDEMQKLVDLECADGRFRYRGYPEGRIADPVLGRDNLDFWAHDERYCRGHSGNLGDATDPFDGNRFTEFSLGTNPTSDTHEGMYSDGSSGFSVTNIRPRGGDMVADFSVPKWSGEIAGEMIWGGVVQVIGDLTVKENATLILHPGTQVRVATSDVTAGGESPEQCEIDVYGTLISRGTFASQVVFSSARSMPGDADWYGVRLHPETIKIPLDTSLEGLVARHAEYGIFWDRHRGESEMTLIGPVVKDQEKGNGDGRASPGETVDLSFTLGNWTFVTFRNVSVEITSDDPYLPESERVRTTRGVSMWFGTSSKFRGVRPGITVEDSSAIAVTIASDCPSGHLIRFDAEITAREQNDAQHTWTEQFTLWVTGEDESAPVVGSPSVSAKYVGIGETATISAQVKEPGPCTVMAKIISVPDSVQVASVPLVDKGKGRYTGSWSPPVGSDYMVHVVATDLQGNQGVSGTPARFFSRPFERTADVLVYADYGMRGVCERALRDREIPYDVWDYDERELLADEALYQYSGGTTIWALSRKGTRGRRFLEAVLGYLRRGGSLLVVVGNLDRFPSSFLGTEEEMEQFYAEMLRVEFLETVSPRTRLAGVAGDPIAEGFSVETSNYGRMSVQRPAKAIVTDGSGRAAAVRVDGGYYRAVYFAFSASLSRENLIGRATEWLMEKRMVREHDVALERVLAPERYTNQVAVIPSVRMVNLGSQEEREVPVVCMIEREGERVYVDRRTVRNLRRDEERSFSFRPWIPGMGVYEFTFYLDFPGDEDETNNVLTAATEVEAFLDVSSSARIDRPAQGRGVAAGDYDNDGDLDLFVARYDGPDLLYRNDRGRFFSEVASQAGVGLWGNTRAAAWGDYDNDGDLDLYVSSEEEANRLYRNEGNGRFVNATMRAGVGLWGNTRAAAWGDYDNDGDLDLYVADADGQGVLYQNEGKGRFVKATSAGVDSTGTARAATWWDYDNDGDLDLYVANYEANALYQNEGEGTFSDQTVSAGLDDRGKCIGLAVGDYDNDGDLDLYVCKKGFNALYRNEGEGTFTDVTPAAGVRAVGMSLGASWGDYDNDGWLDLYVVNYYGRPNVLYRNEGEGVFRDVAGSSGVGDEGDGLGVAFADYDNDGWLDLYVTNDGSDVLYRNRGDRHHWLRVRTVGSVSNRDGIGSRVRVVAGALRMIREISGGGGYCSQDGLWAQFGLGEYDTVDSLVVRWPSGAMSLLTSLPADQEVLVREPPSWKLVSESTDVYARQRRPMTVYPNPFNLQTTITYDVVKTGTVRLSIYALTGQLVRTLVDGERPVGRYSVTWDGRDDRGRDVASNVYVCRMEADEYLAVWKLVVMK